MKRKTVIVATGVGVAVTCAVVLGLAMRRETPRELILLKNGRPMANLTGEYLSCEGGSPSVIRTSTDADGKLDLTGVPEDAPQIAVTLRDDSGVVFNGDLVIPLHGSRTIDRRGNTTISTTRTRVFGLFNSTNTSREVWTRSDEPDDGAKTKGGQADSGDTAR